jgi:hypothetical protein
MLGRGTSFGSGGSSVFSKPQQQHSANSLSVQQQQPSMVINNFTIVNNFQLSSSTGQQNQNPPSTSASIPNIGGPQGGAGAFY